MICMLGIYHKTCQMSTDMAKVRMKSILHSVYVGYEHGSISATLLPCQHLIAINRGKSVKSIEMPLTRRTNWEEW